MLSITDYQKFGIGLTVIGVLCLYHGVTFFNIGLLATGNILVVSGLPLVIGLERTLRFFLQRHDLKGSTFFIVGISVVLAGWPMVGMILEICGLILLFRSATSTTSTIAEIRTGQRRRAGKKRKKKKRELEKKKKEEEEERGKIDHNGTESAWTELGNAHPRTPYSRVSPW